MSRRSRLSQQAVEERVESISSKSGSKTNGFFAVGSIQRFEDQHDEGQRCEGFYEILDMKKDERKTGKRYVHMCLIWRSTKLDGTQLWLYLLEAKTLVFELVNLLRYRSSSPRERKRHFHHYGPSRPT